MTSLRTRIGIGALTLALAFGSACGGVMDELDQANELMDARPGAKAAADAEAAGKQNARPSGDDWWQKAKSLTSEERDPSLVSCRVDGRTQFMRRNDCLARGGRAS